MFSQSPFSAAYVSPSLLLLGSLGNFASEEPLSNRYKLLLHIAHTGNFLLVFHCFSKQDIGEESNVMEFCLLYSK